MTDTQCKCGCGCGCDCEDCCGCKDCPQTVPDLNTRDMLDEEGFPPLSEASYTGPVSDPVPGPPPPPVAVAAAGAEEAGAEGERSHNSKCLSEHGFPCEHNPELCTQQPCGCCCLNCSTNNCPPSLGFRFFGIVFV
jgi:hypothetical protein